MIKINLLHAFIIIISFGVVDKIQSGTSEGMRSDPAHHLLFIFQLENILCISLWSNLNFSPPYGSTE